MNLPVEFGDLTSNLDLFIFTILPILRLISYSELAPKLKGIFLNHSGLILKEVNDFKRYQRNNIR